MPDPFAGRYDDLAVGLAFGAAALLVGALVWGWRRARRGGVVASLAGLAPAAAGVGALAAAGVIPAHREAGLAPAAAVAAVLIAGALLADFDRRRPDGLALPLWAVTVAGVWATVPDIEAAVVVLGAALPPALLGWPSPLARSGLVALGLTGSLASAALLVWVVATDGAARPGSMVGGLACLGVLAVEPVARRLAGRGSGGRPLPPLPLAVGHLALVAVAARVVGRRETVVEALPLAVAALVVGLAVAVAALRRVAVARTPN